MIYTILYYVLVPICLQYICIILLLWHKYSAPLAAPKQLATDTDTHRPPPLKSQWWRSCSGADGGAPVPLPANVRPSNPRPTNVPSIPSVPSSPSVCPLIL